MCSGFCPFLQALSAASPCAFSWLRSPSSANADQSDCPNHAFLVIKRVQDEAQSRFHELALCEIALHVARQLLPQPEWAYADTGQRAGGDADGAQPSRAAVYDSEQSVVTQRQRAGPISPMHAIEVSMSVQANCALERLLGFSQSELRQAFLLDGEKALYGLIHRSHWQQLADLSNDVKWERRREFRVQVSCTTRLGSTMPCILRCLNEFDDSGQPCTTYLSFLPVQDAVS